jgi:hypothetical protein
VVWVVVWVVVVVEVNFNTDGDELVGNSHSGKVG